MRALAKSVLVRALGSPIKDQRKNAVAQVLNDYYGASVHSMRSALSDITMCRSSS